MASPILIAGVPRLYRGSGKTLAIREKEKEWAAGKKGEGSRSGQPMGRRRCGAAESGGPLSFGKGGENSGGLGGEKGRGGASRGK